jgi:proton-dependent oligopeptide transporter, POT family
MSISSKGPLGRFLETFTQMRVMPMALWIIIAAFVIESSAYFGVLTLMSEYLSSNLHWGDQWAGMAVSFFTMCVTLFMLGFGSIAEGLGVRKAILLALLITVFGRLLYCLAAGFSPGLGFSAIVVSLIIVAIGDAILQPVCYAGVKKFTDEKNSSMGYALIYALMNLGIVVVGALSSWLRPAVQDHLDKPGVSDAGAIVRAFATVSGSGIQAVNLACVAINVLALLIFLVFMTRKMEARQLREIHAEESTAPKASALARMKAYFVEGPFSNTRFLFFIFMMLPVRTLFAHQWLTMPSYILRSYDKGVADRMEWLVNWINPAIIFIGVPIFTALTSRVNVYTMMLVGSLVSAVPTFLLCSGPSLPMLITYFVIFSIGEALWSARFLEYASELAPPGRVAQYMGLAQVPWLLAKGTTGLYSGYLLSQYCPANVPAEQLQTGTLWLIYGCIAMSTPLGLWLGRKWVMKGMYQVKV